MSDVASGMWVFTDRPYQDRQASWEFGCTRGVWLRRERVAWTGLQRPVSVLYASDLHLGGRWSRHVSAELIEAARLAAPDIILLGGDLADNGRGLVDLQSCIRKLQRLVPVWAVAGNHDDVVGLPAVRHAVETAGGRWLHNQCDEWSEPSAGVVRLHGCVNNTRSDQRPGILCAHDPAIFPQAARAGYELVLAGHLHGSQCVLAERNGILYPGAWFFRWNGLRFASNGCRMLVSRGMADTLPLRWNCPRELLWCQLHTSQQ
jgi:predicted MPP superfamily phosphohydrolase